MRGRECGGTADVAAALHGLQIYIITIVNIAIVVNAATLHVSIYQSISIYIYLFIYLCLINLYILYVWVSNYVRVR